MTNRAQLQADRDRLYDHCRSLQKALDEANRKLGYDARTEFHPIPWTCEVCKQVWHRSWPVDVAGCPDCGGTRL